jgi:bacteriorhodopsin
MIYTSAIGSLTAQFIVGVIDFLALNEEVKPEDEILKDLLKLELIVQLIEFVFYVWLFFYFSQVSRNITPFRYLDWSITTPIMLITLSGFLNHKGASAARLGDFLSKHAGAVIKIVVLNAAMLFFGFVGELGYLSPYVSTALGFIPFALNFKHIKDTFLPASASTPEDVNKHALFYWFLFFWSLYGVFAVMGYTAKNTGYNILDIFAKNFFGLFLGYIIWSKSNQKALELNKNSADSIGAGI